MLAVIRGSLDSLNVKDNGFSASVVTTDKIGSIDIFFMKEEIMPSEFLT